VQPVFGQEEGLAQLQAPTPGETAGFYPLVHAGSGGQHAGTGGAAGTAAAAGNGTAADAGAQPAATQLPEVSPPAPQNFLQRAWGAITGDPAPGSPGERQLVQQEQQAAQEEALQQAQQAQQAQQGEQQELPAPAQAEQAGAAIAQGPANQGAQPPSSPQQQAMRGITPPTPPSLSPAPAVGTFIIGRHGAALTASQMAAAAALTDRSLLEGQLSLESAGCQSGEEDDRESELHSAGTSSANSR
jgi:type II secretory pathway pseudopilin PulG